MRTGIRQLTGVARKRILYKGADSSTYPLPFCSTKWRWYKRLVSQKRCRQHLWGFKIPCLAGPCGNGILYKGAHSGTKTEWARVITYLNPINIFNAPCFLRKMQRSNQVRMSVNNRW